MSRIIQLILFFVLVLIIYIFYSVYFKENDKAEIEETFSITKPINTTNPKKSNLIKNLKYEINISEKNIYQINSELSEITYVSKDDSEEILMEKVNAIITDKNNISLFITSDNASYNNASYYTNFKNNVKIKYLNNIIFAENMILDFKKNLILVNNNVRYNGPLGNLEADNIKINLITKKIDVFMNDTDENIVITSSK